LTGDVSGAPITYMLDGRQYVAVTAGGRIAPTTTLGRLVGVDVAPGTGTVWVFALPESGPREVPRPARRAGPEQSALDGVFQRRQAEQGEQIFARECSGCHQIDNYVGENFEVKWGGATLSDVYQDISLQMPPADPGGLTPLSYASIVAYFLSLSGYPTGGALPADGFQLGSIRIDPAGEP
jgi:hypothetical protein